MNKFLMTLLTLSALAVAVPVSAATCATTTSNPEVHQGALYVDNDLCQPGCVLSIWIYEESNSIPGLQRQDSGRDDTCGGKIDPDAQIL